MSAGFGFPLTLRGGLLVAAELICLGLAGSAAAVFMWALLDPLAEARPQGAAASEGRRIVTVSVPPGRTDPFFRGATTLAGAAPAASAQGFVLHATRVAGDRSTAIVSAAGLPQSAYRLGESIGDARLVQVFHDRIVIEVGGQQRTVSFPVASVIEAPALNAAPADPAAAETARGMGLSPVTRAGRPSGYQVDRSSPALAAAGFETGDILLDIDGRSLTEEAFANLQTRLVSGGSAEIRFERDGQTMTKRVGGSVQ